MSYDFYLLSCRYFGSMIFRQSDVPSTKLLQCKRHATRLGLNASSVVVDSVEVNNETDKESLGSENGNDVNDNLWRPGP